MAHKWLDWYKDRAKADDRLPDLEGESDWIPVSFVLDMEPDQFAEQQAGFVRRLADVLGADSRAVIIVDVQPGCTKVVVVIQRSRFDELKFLLDYIESQGQEKLPKKLDRLRRDFKVQQFSKVPIIDLFYLRPKSLNFGRDFTWLHLSDAHLQADTGTRHYEQKMVLDAFLRDIPELLQEEGVKPDVVFFTGDVAHSGNPNEYEAARGFVNDLREQLPKRAVDVMFVPGNHDVDHNIVERNKYEDRKLQQDFVDNSEISAFLTAPKFAEPRNRVFKRMEAFLSFLENCQPLGQPAVNHGYFFTKVFEHEGSKIGVAGLNSAWRCKDDKDQGRLILGVPQIQTSKEDLREADLKLMLLHHPPESDWFVHSDLVYQRSNLEFFDFILRGHEHDPHGTQTTQSSFQLGPGYCHVSAGALYTTGNYPRSFNAVRVNLDLGFATVFFWRLTQHTYQWVKDVELFRTGYRPFMLPVELRRKLAVRKRRSAKMTI